MITDLRTYRNEIDSQFIKIEANPPNRLHPKYFNENGTPKPVFDDILAKIREFWTQITRYEPKDIYVSGTHATGKFWEGSDMDIAVLCDCEWDEAKELEIKLGAKMIGKGTDEYTRNLKDYKAGKRDFVHPRVHVVKPYGIVYDIQEKRWVTYGKSEKDHKKFLIEVVEDPITIMEEGTSLSIRASEK